jgi:cytochrome d ubiquinol oxidase subunit I
MTLAAYLTTAMVVAGAAAFGLLRGRANAENKTSLRMAVLMMAFVAPLQFVLGHESGMVALEHQPAKVAAMEGWWEEGPRKPTVLVAWPEEKSESNRFEIAIPESGNFIFGVPAEQSLPGLKQFQESERPPVAITFWAFRIMVGMGVIMLALGVWGVVAWLAKRLDGARLYHRALVLAAPSGFVAVLAGWIAAEVGRQPYVIYGVMRTADALSPVGAGQVAGSLLAYMIVYAIVFSAGALYILRLMGAGPHSGEETPRAGDRAPGSVLTAGLGATGKASPASHPPK